MEKSKTRAQRRHHVARIKAACAKHWTVHRWNEVVDKSSREYLCRLGKAAATPAACSCWSCGNPRRKMGEMTLQEISDAQFADALVKADTLS